MKILPTIQGHDDLLKLSDAQRAQLCREIREFLIENVSKTGGHLAGNLGVVELSVALETVFDTRIDRLIFDVGHQSYVHKLLTGRQAHFDTLRQYEGISGFPQPRESETDAFVAGHASSSVSIALGMALARTLEKQTYHVVSVIGDGAATGGMAYEGLNNAAVSKEPMIIILNDNEMSIGKNVGGFSRHLSRIRSSRKYLRAKIWYREAIRKLPGGQALYVLSSRIKNRIKRAILPATFFENMGIDCLGPVDGSDLPGLISVLNNAKEMKEPVLIHVLTKKGRGYKFAEADPAKFHGIGKFDPVTGQSLGTSCETFSASFGACLCELAETEPKLCAITAAMPAGTGLSEFMGRYPDRAFDVGIAEEHAVSMAGGLAKQGMIPVVAIYSTFLQRAFDQMMQDVALLGLHAVFAVDRAGLVGDDGPTHHGVFDVGYLRQIPGFTVLTPATLSEQRSMLSWAVKECCGPVAVRYPRGTEGDYKDDAWRGDPNAVVVCKEGRDVTLLTYGTMVNHALDAARSLHEQGIDAGVIRLLSVSHLDAAEITKAMGESRRLIVVEETAANSGIHDALCTAIHELNPEICIRSRNLGAGFVPHGAMSELYRLCGLDSVSIADFTKGVLSHEG